MSDNGNGDYFVKLHKRTQPIRDTFKPKPAAATKPISATPKAPEATKPIGQLQGESLEDWTYMRGAQERINKKLSPKSVMGKSSPKR